jgi:hypothetical protein
MPRRKSGEETTDLVMEDGTPEPTSETGDRGESVNGYFTRFFEQNPQLLKIRSNEAAFAAWMADHPEDSEVPDKVKNAVSNVKSSVKMKLKKNKVKAKTKANPDSNNSAKIVSKPATNLLQSLEENIDKCLAMARTLEPQGLEQVISSLRSARNEVILKQDNQ